MATRDPIVSVVDYNNGIGFVVNNIDEYRRYRDTLGKEQLQKQMRSSFERALEIAEMCVETLIETETQNGSK